MSIKIDKIPDRAFVRVSLEELGTTIAFKPFQILPEIVFANDKSKKQYYIVQVPQFRDAFVIRDDKKKFEQILSSIIEIVKKKAEDAFNAKLADAKISIDHDYFIISKNASGKEVKSSYKEVDVDKNRLIMKFAEYEKGYAVQVPLCSLFKILYDKIYEEYVDVSNLI